MKKDNEKEKAEDEGKFIRKEHVIIRIELLKKDNEEEKVEEEEGEFIRDEQVAVRGEFEERQ